jgi:O-antigen/teichoic acid export membrane protein
MFAAWGFGVGALVARELASVAIGALLLWLIYPFRPKLQLIPRLAWGLFRYGAWVGAGLTILFLSQNIDVFIGGHIIHSKSDIGFYTTSWRLAFIAAGVFTVVLSSVLFPALSRLQDNQSALREKLLKGMRHLGLMMFPATALLATLAPVLIVPLLGDEWSRYRASFEVLSILTVYAGIRTMLFVFFEGYKSVGKPWIFPVYNSVKLVIMVPAMIVGARHGIIGLALAYIPIQLIEIPISFLLAYRILDITPRAVWRAGWVPFVSSLAMAAAAVATEIVLLRSLHQGDVITLAVCIVVAVIVYPLCLSLLDRDIVAESRTVILEGL